MMEAAVQTRRDGRRVIAGATTEPHARRAYSAVFWLAIEGAVKLKVVEGRATRWA